MIGAYGNDFSVPTAAKSARGIGPPGPQRSSPEPRALRRRRMAVDEGRHFSNFDHPDHLAGRADDQGFH
jgi:hypothetical protein